MANLGTLLFLPGDGIGPEVMDEVRHVCAWLSKAHGHDFEIVEGLVGGASYDAHETPLTDDTLDQAKAADAVLLGAVGGPKWDDLDFAVKPERGLLRLRKEMDLYANLRPAIVFDALVDASSLKPDLISGLDILIVRELTGGVYFGEPRGIEDLGDGTFRGVNTQVYETEEIRQVGRVAFDLARKRGSRVCSVEKSNVMESGLLWRNEMDKLHQAEYADMELSHMYADNCAMQLVREPKQFDVIVTDNLFGDILSDEAAMLTGSLGMLPSASLGNTDANGRRGALYEPVHGSAPDIAGTGAANPLATILSFAMMLRYSFGLESEAAAIETAAGEILKGGLRTADIMQPGMAKVSTHVMGEALIGALEKSEVAAV